MTEGDRVGVFGNFGQKLGIGIKKEEEKEESSRKSGGYSKTMRKT
jgi:hypothetical protein